MENIKKEELQALLDTLKGQEYSSWTIYQKLYDTIGSNPNYHNQFRLRSVSWSPYFIVVATNDEYEITLFEVQIRRQKGKTYGWHNSEWFIKDIEIDFVNENVEKSLNNAKEEKAEQKRKEMERKENGIKVIQFLKEQGYNYWERRQILNAAIYEDGNQYDKENNE